MAFPSDYIEKLYKEQKGKCYYCGCSLKEEGYHIEHMMPLSRGGEHSLKNVVLSCPTCNFSKGSKTVKEFLIYKGEQNDN